MQTKMFLTVVLLTIVIVTLGADKVNYTNYKVFRVQASTSEQLEILADYSENEHFNFWSPLRRNKAAVDVMVAPPAQQNFTDTLKHNNMQYQILTNNIEQINEEQKSEAEITPREPQSTISFKKYHRHKKINKYLEELKRLYPDLVNLEVAGKSYEGRDLKVIQISTNPNATKPIIFIDAGIHAREWIAPAQALYIINQLVENPDNIELLKYVDWHILPILNPDGYEYTHDTDRFWRKTRSMGSRCKGVDANRNFDYHWGEGAVKRNECAPTFIGRSPFSEPEIIAFKNYILKHKYDIKLYLTLHSYGDYLLFPWGYTSDLPHNYKELQSLGELVANTIHKVRGGVYTVGTSTNILYEASGGSDDWVKGVAGIELSYTMELPGTAGGWAGFDPANGQILPIVEETWEGMKAFHHYIKNKYGKNSTIQ